MRKIVTAIFVIILTVFIGIFIAYQWYNNVIFAENIQQDEVIFIVESGDSLLTVAPKLEAAGLIGSEQALKVYVRLNNISANIKAGEYSIGKGTNVPNLIKIMEEGTYKASLNITIPEGMRYEDIADLLQTKFTAASESSNFKESEFLDICANPDSYDFSEVAQAILIKYKPSGKSLHGLLFPDTYRFDFDSSTITVISAMIQNLDKRLIENDIIVENLNKNQTSLKSIYDVITLASIIEKEAGNDPDRPIVSSIFHNRLKSNYPLQSDITIHFIKNDGDTFISFKDLELNSLYNTYKYAGLTPTPINNPGISSIKAAINPDTTDYFFFIYDELGKLYYAVTYQQHLVNVNKYL